MSATGPNLPLVIQQSGDASRLQDVTQRLGEEQQAAVEQERRRRAQRQKSQVQETERSDGQNRVRADADGGREKTPRRRPGRRHSGADRQDEPGAEPRPDSGVINVVV